MGGGRVARFLLLSFVTSVLMLASGCDRFHVKSFVIVAEGPDESEMVPADDSPNDRFETIADRLVPFLLDYGFSKKPCQRETARCFSMQHSMRSMRVEGFVRPDGAIRVDIVTWGYGREHYRNEFAQDIFGYLVKVFGSTRVRACEWGQC